jgi:membrane-associated protein
MFQQLIDVATHSDWAYLLVFAIAALDAVFPVVPSEATLITAAALAASGRLDLAAVFVAGAGGAALGDNGAYLIGRVSAGGVRRIMRSPRAQAAMRWAERELRARGATIVIASRFVPGGRTATMLTAGVTGLRWRRFVLLDLVAALLWAAYGSALGLLGGVAFAHRPLYAVGVALSLAAALVVALEGGRRLVRRRTRRTRGTPDGDGPPRA